MSAPNPYPIDYNLVFTQIISYLKKVTKTEVMLAKPTASEAQRPKLPYVSMNILSPGIKYGDDEQRYEGDYNYSFSGPRAMSVSFNSFAVDRATAYGLMTLIQSKLEGEDASDTLRPYGITIQSVGSVADLSELLQTGFEARGQLDVTFGLTAVLTEDLGRIEHVKVKPNVKDVDGTVVEDDEYTIN